MAKKSRRTLYDPSIVDRPLDPTAVIQVEDRIVPYPTSVNENDVDGLFLETINVDSEPERQQIRDVTLHGMLNAPPKKKKISLARIMILATIIVAGLIVIIVTTAVVVSKRNQRDDTPSSLDYVITLLPPPSNLYATCNSPTEQGGDYTKCQEICERAECCEFPPNFDMSCLKDHESMCLEYHKACHVLYLTAIDQVSDGGKVVEHAPLDLPLLCAPNNLTANAGVQSCKEICQPYRCCWDVGVAACVEQPTCQEYAPCLNLRAHDFVHDSISDQIAEDCQYDKVLHVSGRQQCRERCKLGRCCFQQKTCPDRAEGFCYQYRDCDILFAGTLPEALPDDDVTGDGTDDGYGIYTGNDKLQDDLILDDKFESQTLEDDWQGDDDFVKGDDWLDDDAFD